MSRIANATTPRQVRRLTLAAFFGPPLIVALALLAANPDFGALGLILGTLALVGTLMLMLIAAPNGWLVVSGVLVGIAVLAVPGPLLQAEVMAHQGQRVEVRITSVTKYRGKHGPEYTCHLERVDGKPLAHAELGSDSCYGPLDVGRTEDVLVDPHGWTAPQLVDTDYGGVDVAAALLPVAVLLFELLIWLARRSGLRRTGGR
ncbi:hypothetical protein ACFYNO_07290 [Kitasatospora sp. NPDC006697]|uniref:hypothetical protein n=1 Tax=Kitasatospora sp. NPDC006697 TaxID=3364020 RepID=UPI0036BD8F67